MKKYRTTSTYWQNADKVRQLCFDSFGDAFDPYNVLSVFSKNKWYMNTSGQLVFRDEKDLLWFTLKAANLVDVEVGWWEPAGMTTGRLPTTPAYWGNFRDENS